MIAWEQHIERTAELLRKIQPHHIRIRRLWIYRQNQKGLRVNNPLVDEILAGRFQPQTAEGTVHELQRLIQLLKDCPSQLFCDHDNNYVRIAGDLTNDRNNMLEQIDAFLSLSPHDRELSFTATGSVI
jgi:hypothetical protein